MLGDPFHRLDFSCVQGTRTLHMPCPLAGNLTPLLVTPPPFSHLNPSVRPTAPINSFPLQPLSHPTTSCTQPNHLTFHTSTHSLNCATGLCSPSSFVCTQRGVAWLDKDDWRCLPWTLVLLSCSGISASATPQKPSKTLTHLACRPLYQF